MITLKNKSLTVQISSLFALREASIKTIEKSGVYRATHTLTLL